MADKKRVDFKGPTGGGHSADKKEGRQELIGNAGKAIRRMKGGKSAPREKRRWSTLLRVRPVKRGRVEQGRSEEKGGCFKE